MTNLGPDFALINSLAKVACKAFWEEDADPPKWADWDLCSEDKKRVFRNIARRVVEEGRRIKHAQQIAEAV